MADEIKDSAKKEPRSYMHLRIVSAEKKLYSDNVRAVTVKGEDGELGIRPGHTALLSSIPAGNASYVDMNGERKYVHIAGGIIEVQPNSVTILADTAIRGEDIDESKALEAKRQAEEKLSNTSGDINYSQAFSELSRALSQLKAVELSRKGRVK